MFELWIALRYLFAKKTYNVINIISIISIIGICLGTAALIVSLSIFNGFEDLIKQSLNKVEADIIISKKGDNLFLKDEALIQVLKKDTCISAYYSILETKAYIEYDTYNAIANLRGVDSAYINESGIREKFSQPNAKLYFGQIPQCIVNEDLAVSIHLNTRLPYPIKVKYPIKGGKINILNPEASLKVINLSPVCVLDLNNQITDNLILAPKKEVSELLTCGDKISYVFVRVKPNCNEKIVVKNLKNQLGDKYLIKNKLEQNPNLYKMMKYEKLSVYTILVFILLIISANIFSCLSMLIIEKKNDILILQSMGLSNHKIIKIFTLTGWFISFIGWIIGLLLGLLFCIAQLKFGILKLPTNFSTQQYPLIINTLDILYSSIIILLIGYLIARLSCTTHTAKHINQ